MQPGFAPARTDDYIRLRLNPVTMGFYLAGICLLSRTLPNCFVTTAFSPIAVARPPAITGGRAWASPLRTRCTTGRGVFLTQIRAIQPPTPIVVSAPRKRTTPDLTQAM